MKPNTFIRWATVATVAALTACQPTQHRYQTIDGVMLGTTLHVIADVPELSQQELRTRILRLDAEAKASMSIFDSLSLLSRLNRNETDTVDAHIAYNLRLADSISRISDGRYDVTVKPLVEAWGFAGRNRTADPNVDSLLEFVGHEKVHIEGNRLIKSDPRVALDFNSIAKGYTVDLLAALVEEAGAQNYIVDIGGELRCRGVNAHGNAWRVGIETPFDGNQTNGEYLQRRLQINKGALATSGNYRRFYLDAAGNKVAHTIDPRTGRSAVSRLLSVTVAAATCAEADALGTMLLAMGVEDATAFVAEHPELAVYFILAPLAPASESSAENSAESLTGNPAENSKNSEAANELEFEEYISPAMQNLIAD